MLNSALSLPEELSLFPVAQAEGKTTPLLLLPAPLPPWAPGAYPTLTPMLFPLKAVSTFTPRHSQGAFPKPLLSDRVLPLRATKRAGPRALCAHRSRATLPCLPCSQEPRGSLGGQHA